MAEWSEERCARVQGMIQRLYEVVSDLQTEFKSDGRKFTPDGHLVGSIGEVVAAYTFDLELHPPSTPIHDARSKDGRNIQIKFTASSNQQIALTSKPDQLIVLQLTQNSIKLIYNGLGQPAWEHCRPRNEKNGQRTISLKTLIDLDKEVAPTNRIEQIRAFPNLRRTA